MFCQALVCAALLAASVDENPSLGIGDKAPEMSVEHWVKGSELKSFEKGTIYVVEFWATWCGPCIESIPHLTDLQKTYKEKKVTVIGVAASEAPEGGDEKLAGVKSFVADKGEKMDYTVAVDTDRSMGTSWMEAAHQEGIPTAFVINGDGMVAWIGHPRTMDKALESIVAGTYDLKAAAEKFKRRAELEQKVMGLQQKLAELANEKKWDEALSTLDEIVALDEEEFGGARLVKLQIMLTEKQDEVKAYGYAKEILPKLWDKADLLNGLAWLIVDPDVQLKSRDLELALKAGVRASELTKDKDPNMLDTLARVYATKGDYAKAAELQQKAISLTDDPDTKQALEGSLKEYQEKSKKT